jgi:hypothetical protein
MESSGYCDVSRSQMLAIEVVSIMSMIVLFTQGIVSSFVDAAIVVLALSIAGYIVIYIYNRTISAE